MQDKFETKPSSFFKPVVSLNRENKNHPDLQLDAEHPFRYADLDLTSVERECLEKLNINPKLSEQAIYNNYGELDKIETEVASFLNALGDNDAITPVITKMIQQIIAKVLNFYNQETAWVTIRAFLPTPLFKMPRWHRDGYYYSPYSGDQYKVAVTLKGPSTLFFQASSEQRKRMKELASQQPRVVNGKLDMQLFMQHMTYEREELNKIFDPKLAVFAEIGQASLFIAGAEHAAVHSEPDINCPRLFMSVLPGSKHQILELLERQSNTMAKP